jgi:hypothetical protein
MSFSISGGTSLEIGCLTPKRRRRRSSASEQEQLPDEVRDPSAVLLSIEAPRPARGELACSVGPTTQQSVAATRRRVADESPVSRHPLRAATGTLSVPRVSPARRGSSIPGWLLTEYPVSPFRERTRTHRSHPLEDRSFSVACLT